MPPFITIVNSIELRKILNISQSKQCLLKVFWLKDVIQKIPFLKKSISITKENMLQKVSPVEKRNYDVHWNALILKKINLWRQYFLCHWSWNKSGHGLLHFKACSARRVSHSAGIDCSWTNNFWSWFHLDSVSNYIIV